MSINRTALVKGPIKAVYTYDDDGATPTPADLQATFYQDKDVTLNIDQKTINIEPDALGKIDERASDVEAKVSIIPEGRWNASLIAALHPYTNFTIGKSIFGHPANPGTDRTLALHGSADLTTLVNAAVTKCPPLVFSAAKSLFGAVEFTGIRKNDSAWSVANSLLNVTGTGTFADAGFTGPALIKTQPYALTLGAVTGFVAQDCEDGFQFETNLKIKMFQTDRLGTIDGWFQSLEAMVKFKPLTTTLANAMAALLVQDTGAVRGRSLSSNGAQLTIVGDDTVTYLTIPNASLKGAGFRFGSTVLRNGEYAFVANRTFTGGAANPLYTLAAGI